MYYTEFNAFCLNRYNKSQLKQDLWVLFEKQEKRNGFFVEFGAGDGVTDSNTWILEKDYGWNGILAEPNRSTFQKVKSDRNCTVVDAAVVGSDIDRAVFLQTQIPYLSTMAMYNPEDHLAEARKSPVTYEVQCLTLDKLLRQYNAPAHIDYLSIDVEGGELDIIGRFPFKDWTIDLLTIEHNYVAESRTMIERIMNNNGYLKANLPDEVTLWDDWYRRMLF